LRDPPFGLQVDIAEVLETTFNSRWDMVFSDMHYVEALLNPYIRDYVQLKMDRVATCTLYQIIYKMKDVVGVHFNDILAELLEYKESFGPYSLAELSNIHATNILPHQWWHKIGDRPLSKIVVCILSLTYSASPCKWNWSMYSFVHTPIQYKKNRNRLATITT